MAMQQLTLPGQIVKKHNELIRSKINISNQTASRILACLVACIRHEDTKFNDSYSVPISSYFRDDGGIYKQVRDACRELATATVETEWPDPENPDGDPILLLMPFFTSIKYRRGYVQAKFNQEMSGFLLQLRQCFTQYNLMDYLTLPSLYSQRIFELLKSWGNMPEVVFSVAELHRLLDTPASFRLDFRQFRVYVLEKAHKDIHAKTQLRFEWEPVKVGRSVEAIRFLFGPKRKALAKAETQKAKEEKKRRLENERWMKAYNCALSKAGNCLTQDNKPIICKSCLKLNFCADLRRSGKKKFAPTN